MPLIIIPDQGLSIAEQKCYLLHQGDNQAIISCLEAIAHSTDTGMAIALACLVGFCLFMIVVCQ